MTPVKIKLAVLDTINEKFFKLGTWFSKLKEKGDSLTYQLSNPRQFGQTSKNYSESNDVRLLSCFHQDSWKRLREESLLNRWGLDFSSLENFHKSTKRNRNNLKKHLGKWHSDHFEILDEESVRTESNSSEITHVLLKSGIPDLVFDAYVVVPINKNQYSKFAVITLHGHESSAEKLVGIGPEDYGRRMALRFSEQGFYVIVPSITSKREINNIISAHAHIYGYSLLGISSQFILSAQNFLQSRYSNLKHFGISGISNGGLLSLISGALSPKIKFVLASGILQSVYNRVLHPRNVYDATEYYFYLQGPFWMEFDIAEIAMLVAPRILLFEVGSSDKIVAEWRSEYLKISNIYQKLGYGSRIDTVSFYGKHEFAENFGIEALKEKINLHPELFEA